MYFVDLSPYCYRWTFCLKDVLNIGWLDAVHPFTVGDSPREFLGKLRRLIAGAYRDVDVHANRMRCVHPCNLCGEDEFPLHDLFGRSYALGMSEIWIPGDSKWYASPSMILHYVEVHHYLPATEFITAVQRMSVTEPYDAEALCRQFEIDARQRAEAGSLATDKAAHDNSGDTNQN